MLSWLRRFFSPDLAALNDQLTAHGARLKALEDERLDLLVAWEKTRGQVLRYMKRAGALREGVDSEPEADKLARRVLDLKFPRQGT